jgi:hypothetical protein
MRKILVAIILAIMSFSSVMADSKKEKKAKFDYDNFKYIPKDKLIDVHCIVYGIIEFPDGGFFCLEKQGKLTNESFLKSKYTGTYYYPNGNEFSGKFFKGKKLEGKMDKSKGTEIVDCEGLKIFTCDYKKTIRYQKYYKGSGNLDYDVYYWLYKRGKCELRPYFPLLSSYKKGWNKKSHGLYILERHTNTYKAREPVDKYEVHWCYDRHYTTLGPFIFKDTYLYAFIISITSALLLFYLIILSRRNNAIHKYNLKHKTKFKKYSDYKKHIDKIKLKEFKKDEKRRTKLDKTSNLDDENLGSSLKKIKRMYNSGSLTKAEFEKAKNKLLK